MSNGHCPSPCQLLHWQPCQPPCPLPPSPLIALSPHVSLIARVTSVVFRRYLHSPHIRNVGCKHQRLLSVSQSHTLLRTQKRYHDHDLVDGAHNPNDLKVFPKHDQDLPVSQYFHQISRLALQLASATTQRTTRPTCTTPSASSTSASVCLTLAPMDA